MSRITRTIVATAFAVAVFVAAPVRAQVPDHLKCYKIKDTLNLGGTADLDTPQFGVDPGCKISKAQLFCVPATKANVSVVNKKTRQSIAPLPFSGAPQPGDQICYKVKCPTPLTPIPDQVVTDQFGNRTLTKLKASFVCVPAVKGTAYCGDGTIDAGEDCESSDLGGATCTSLGFASGTLACAPGCTFDLGGCVPNPPETCGNGTIETPESCDGSNLGGATCVGFGFASGSLACTAGCGYDVSGCVPYPAPIPTVTPTLTMTPTPTPTSTGDCPLGGVFCDDFNDDSMNAAFWAVYVFGTGPQIAETTGRLETTLPANSQDDPQMGMFGTRYQSVCTLRGDFDLQAEFTLLDWPPANGVRVGLLAGGFGATRLSWFGSDWYLSGEGPVGPEDLIATTDLVGKLRIVRVGATITGYYFNAESRVWVALNSQSTSTDDVTVRLGAWSHNYLFGHQTARAAFDNFVISQGELVCPG